MRALPLERGKPTTDVMPVCLASQRSWRAQAQTKAPSRKLGRAGKGKPRRVTCLVPVRGMGKVIWPLTFPRELLLGPPPLTAPRAREGPGGWRSPSHAADKAPAMDGPISPPFPTSPRGASQKRSRPLGFTRLRDGRVLRSPKSVHPTLGQPVLRHSKVTPRDVMDLVRRWRRARAWARSVSMSAQRGTWLPVG